MLFDPDSPAERAKAEALAKRVSMRAIAMGGTCTGEHGVGMHKLDALVAEHGDAVELMKHDQARARPARHHESRQDGAPSDMYTLYIGNKNYSSWSLRGWLVTRLSGAPFREVPVGCTGTSNPDNLRVLADGARACAARRRRSSVWDSLAIAEYLAERHPGMWPADPAARAWARSIAAEMHSGFSALRNDMTMCIRERLDVRPWSDALDGNIARVRQIWNESRTRFGAGGAFLCGAFSIADAFYAPVAFRFQTYGVAPAGRGRRRISPRCSRIRSCANGRPRRWRRPRSSRPTSRASSIATSSRPRAGMQ